MGLLLTSAQMRCLGYYELELGNLLRSVHVLLHSISDTYVLE